MDLTHELKGQSVTCDKFFTSYALGHGLLKRHLTMLGTMSLNSLIIYQAKKMFTLQSSFLLRIPRSYLTFQGRGNKSEEISNGEDKKPKK